MSTPVAFVPVSQALRVLVAEKAGLCRGVDEGEEDVKRDFPEVRR